MKKGNVVTRLLTLGKFLKYMLVLDCLKLFIGLFKTVYSTIFNEKTQYKGL